MRAHALVVWIALAIAGACTISAPDYGGAHFRCDADHACPDGVACVGGICGGSGTGTGSGSADAGLAGVICGAETCTPDQACCADVLAGPRCQAASAGCAGVSSRCDGPEDCPGQECCLGGTKGACVAAGSCATEVLCHVAADCAGHGGSCCPVAQLPWSSCFAACP